VAASLLNKGQLARIKSHIPMAATIPLVRTAMGDPIMVSIYLPHQAILFGPQQAGQYIMQKQFQAMGTR
jgi:hypothetical protein